MILFIATDGENTLFQGQQTSSVHLNLNKRKIKVMDQREKLQRKMKVSDELL